MKSIKALLLPPVVEKLIERVISATRRTYHVGKIKLSIPPLFDLPNIQRKHILYDRFLTELAKQLNDKKPIIDIGANIGDTALAIAQFCENRIIAIEPSLKYLPFLEKNIRNARKSIRNEFVIEPLMIGTSQLSGTLSHSVKGTAKLETNLEGPAAVFTSLDTVIQKHGTPGLIKTDTDGFDFDVLLSGVNSIRQYKPILFWENEVKNHNQLTGFSELYRQLESSGYRWIFVFDNFGNLLFELSDFQALDGLNKYTLSMNEYGHTRTFYYVDVLAATDDNHLVCQRAVENFSKEKIFKTRS